MTRGFLQIAGFTFGKATSFFDIVPGASFAYNAGMFHHPDTGDAGKMLAAYTAQFGNGVSGTIALEQSRVRGIVPHRRTSAYYVRRDRTECCGDTVLAALGASGHAVQRRRRWPRACPSIPIWSATSASISPGAPGWSALLLTINRAVLSARLHMRRPTRTVRRTGREVRLGSHHRLHLNLPMIAPGDRLSAGIVYSEGAVGYAAVTPSGGATNIASNRVNGSRSASAFPRRHL